MNSLSRGFHVVPVDWATKTILGYDLNLSDWNHSLCLSALPLSSLSEGESGIIAERDALKAQCAVLAGVNGHKENLRQSVANSLNVPQIFFLTIHSCIWDSRMWLHIMLPLPAWWPWPYETWCFILEMKPLALFGKRLNGRNVHCLCVQWRCCAPRGGWCEVPVCCTASSIADPLGKGLCMRWYLYLPILISLKPCRSPYRQCSDSLTVSPVASGLPPCTHNPNHRHRWWL